MVANFDIAVLRTLIAVVELGGLASAATRVGRSESAVSLQIKKLEEQIGAPLFKRSGRRLVLTRAGEITLDHARRLVALNDEAVAALIGRPKKSRVRLGVPQDFAGTWLPAVQARFASLLPSATVETSIARSPALVRLMQQDELDVAVAFIKEESDWASWTTKVPMRWIGPAEFRPPLAELPVPLAVFDPPCLFRAAAEAALDKAGMRWSIALSCPNLASLWASVGAGIGITVRTPVGLPPQLRALEAEAGLPALPDTTIALGVRSDTHAAQSLAEIIQDALTTTLNAAF